MKSSYKYTLMYNRPKKKMLVTAGFILAIIWLWLFMTAYWHCSCDYEGDVVTGMNYVAESVKAANASMKQVCYYWIPRYGKSVGGFLTPKDIDPNICTHIIISCARIQNSTIVPVTEEHTKVYSDVMSLRKQNPNLLVLLCLADGFESLVRDQESIAVFAFNAQQFLVSHGFDGLDLDWEFPGWPAWKKDPRERKWFTYLVLQLNNALKLASHPPLKLSLAVGSPQSIVDSSYEVSELAKYVDFVSIMGYDYHMFQSYMPFTGHNSPLAPGLKEVGLFAKLNIEWSANYWLEKGMPKEKIVVGIPTYGRTWKLLSEDWYNVGAPAVGTGMLYGELSYTEACIFVKEGARRYFDSFCQVPYSVRERDWVSYEDVESITAKTKWIKENGFAGVMTWNLNCDDWAGICSGERFQLHNIIKSIIHAQ
ncbi:chitinase-3-like protein 2 [Palaemon carinicauda]|uniref:chitinase-3-like protein 2 n=1 Tax=Palaemon carinicauda TaxID=392227 RepID=UPI0035B69412